MSRSDAFKTQQKMQNHIETRPRQNVESDDGRYAAFSCSLARTEQLKLGTATVSVAFVGVPPTGFGHRTSLLSLDHLQALMPSAGRRRRRARHPRSPIRLPGESNPAN